jgi:hypothetical protein
MVYLHLLGNLDESLIPLFPEEQVQLCINLLTVGKSWNKISKGLPDGNLGRIVITINPSTAFTNTGYWLKLKNLALYQSNDEGRNLDQTHFGHRVNC